MSAATAAAAAPAPVVELPRAWAEITHRAPMLAETMTAYLEELAGRLSPASVAVGRELSAPIRPARDRY